jgi:thioredoxin 1
LTSENFYRIIKKIKYLKMHDLTKENFDETIDSGKTVLVDMWAIWCGPCKVLGPIIDQLDKKYENNNDVVITKLNVDKEKEIASKLNIRSIPTILIYRDGEVKETLVGLRSAHALSAAIEKVRNKPMV